MKTHLLGIKSDRLGARGRAQAKVAQFGRVFSFLLCTGMYENLDGSRAGRPHLLRRRRLRPGYQGARLQSRVLAPESFRTTFPFYPYLGVSLAWRSRLEGSERGWFLGRGRCALRRLHCALSAPAAFGAPLRHGTAGERVHFAPSLLLADPLRRGLLPQPRPLPEGGLELSLGTSERRLQRSARAFLGMPEGLVPTVPRLVVYNEVPGAHCPRVPSGSGLGRDGWGEPGGAPRCSSLGLLVRCSRVSS